MTIDAYTREHLNSWLTRAVSNDDDVNAMLAAAMLAYVEEQDADYWIDWPKVFDRVNGHDLIDAALNGEEV